MPITVACSCGAKLKAPDSAAGKRVKCPKCGDPLTVPAAVIEYEVVDDKTPPPVMKKQRVLDEDDELPVPARSKAKSRRAPVEVDESIDDEEEDRPKKAKSKGKKVKGKNREEQKKKQTLMLIVGACGAVFVLGAVGVTIGIIMNSPDPAKVGMSTQSVAPKPPPAGWKVFKTDGMSVWVPESVTLKEKAQGPGEKPTPPVLNGKSWTNFDPKNPPKQEVAVYEIGRGELDPQFVARHQQNPAAAWEELTKQAKADGVPGLQLSVTDCMLGGEQGKQLVMPLPNNIRVTSRTIIKGGKMFVGTVIHQNAGESDPLVDTFFDSFKFE